MRILFVTPPLDKPGGVAIFCREVREHFSEDVDYFTVGARADNQSARTAAVRIVGDFRRLSRKLRKEHYDLVHFNPSLLWKAVIREGLSILSAKSSGARVVVLFHGWDRDLERRIRRCFLPLFRAVFFRADALMVVASEFKQSLIEMGCRKPVHVGTSVVSNEIFDPINDPSQDDCRDDGAVSPLRILYLSRVEKAKGVYETLDAFRILKEKHSDAVLTVAGDGSELAGAREYAAGLGMRDVLFAGYLEGEQKRRAFVDADVYLFPTSHGEGMPHSTLEAMAYGLPVITRPEGGIRDFFENGKMGFASDSHDPAWFADGLEKLADDPGLRSEIGLYNRQYAGRHFAASTVAARLENVYREVVGDGK